MATIYEVGQGLGSVAYRVGCTGIPQRKGFVYKTARATIMSVLPVGSPPPELAGGGATGVLVCGGKCGDLSCSLSFSSPVTLSHHIQLSQLLCTGVSHCITEY